MTIGTFARASEAQVTGSELVQTSGYSAAGKGAALYVYDAAVNAAYVAANPRTSFRDANGLGFRLSLGQIITPFMFGAQGAPGTFDTDVIAGFRTLPDDTANLQAFFTFCANNDVRMVNWGGVFGVTATLIMGDTNAHTQSQVTDASVFEGNLALMVKSNINGAVLRCRNRRGAEYGPLIISGQNSQNAAFSSRLFDVGLIIEDQAQMQTFTNVTVQLARVLGVYNNGINNEAPPFQNNVYQNRILSGLIAGCGSGSHYGHQNFNSGLWTTSGGRANSGDSASYNQRTSLNVAGQPPAWMDEYNLPCFIRFPDHPAFPDMSGATVPGRSGQLYRVMERDPANGVVRVFPWVSPSIPQNTALQYVIGGGIYSYSGDAGMLDARLALNGNAFGVVNNAVYGNHIQATMQFNACGYLFGIGDAMIGHSLAGYFEGNDCDIYHSGNGILTLENEQALDLNKIHAFLPKITPAGPVAKHLKVGMLFNFGGQWHHPEHAPDVDGNYGVLSVGFTGPYGSTIPLHGDNPDIRIVRTDPVWDRLFGYRARRIDITGTGAGNKPAGTVTVRPMYEISAGNIAIDMTRKINGGALGAAATFNTFSGPVSLQVAMDPADATNYLVSILAGKT